MDYEISCPKGHRVRVTEAHFGREIKCPTCGAPFVVPDLNKKGEEVWMIAPDLPNVDTSAPTRRRGFHTGLDMNTFSLMAGRPMMAIGLIFVLMSRGCDSLGKRSVASIGARSSMARNTFDDEWEEKQLSIRKKIGTIDDKEEKTPEDSERRSELRKSLAELGEDRAEARRLKEQGQWRDLTIKARDASDNNKIGAYWRELFFVCSTLVLAVGLLAVSWTAEGAERWVCLIMLTILTFSIYIGGVAWIGLPM